METNMPLQQVRGLGFCKQTAPWPDTVLGPFCEDTFVRSRSGPEFRSNSDGTRFGTTYSTLLRSMGTEFKVMQELLRHSTLSTLDVYTQALAPAKHAAQAAIFSLVFSGEANGTSQPSGPNDLAGCGQIDRDEKGHK
jgi:hypothetical protein